MINLGTGPNVLLGFVISFASMTLYLIRIFYPKISRDKDLLLMTVGLMYGSILIIHGWRLDPILTFSQLLLVIVIFFLGYENFMSRNLNLYKKKSYFSIQKMLLGDRKQDGEMNRKFLGQNSKLPSNRLSKIEDLSLNKDKLFDEDFIFDYRDFEEEIHDHK
uniref:Ycf66 n=1 Tax=Gronococcus sybilensis TaxID=3028029 RepID=A0A9Y1I2L7_9RHOD|nr:hypothetical protein Ycf66 [Gronococcus sybilensis]